MITLDLAPLNKKLLVSSLAVESVEFDLIKSRLMHLGFIKDEPVIVIQKAPFFQIPILVEIRGRRIALSAGEARMINVEESL